MEVRVMKYGGNKYRFIRWSVIWDARFILIGLLKRDLLITYKQTLLGAFWTLIKPMAMSAAIFFVFKKVGQFPTFGAPYLLIALSAFTVWEFFSSSVGKGNTSLVDERDLITKINFPRIIIPLSTSMHNVIGLAINQIVIFGLMVYYGSPFTINLLLIPIIYVLVFIANLSTNLLLSTANVYYRDIRNMVPFALRLGLFISPVGFTFKVIPEEWRLLYSLNPLTGIIELMRFSILGEQFLPETRYLICSGFSLFFVLILSLFVFGKYERRFADII